MRPTLKFFSGLFYVNVVYKSNTESSALSRQCFLRWKETQWVVAVCLFCIFAGFVMDSEKSAGSFYLFLTEGYLLYNIALVSTKHQYESVTEFQTLSQCALSSLKGSTEETGLFV